MALSPGGQRLAAVRRVALGLLAQHGLAGWSFGYNRRKASLGVCFHGRKLIELSIHLVERNGAEEVLDTLLHDVAHALVGPDHGHDAVWKRKYVEVGAWPGCCGEADMPEGRWRSVCGACGSRFSQHRKPKRPRGWFCRRCGPKRGRLVWTQTDAPVS
jgi:predicted SprT family Zn-dependent metalloprotease